MPVYEYRCQSCGKDFEYEHRMSEKKTVCEACGGELERLISRTSFAFKGGGWYKDLYASSKPADAFKEAGKDGSGGGSASSDGGSSSKDSGSSAGGSSSSSGSGGSSGSSGSSSAGGSSSSGGGSSGSSGSSSGGGSGGSKAAHAS